MKAIRWLLKLMLVMITLPLILAVWLAKWFVVFLHHCSAWINANKDTFKMYTDMFLTEYIILAIHLNSQGALSDVVLNKVKKNANLMI